jgi:FdhD protein
VSKAARRDFQYLVFLNSKINVIYQIPALAIIPVLTFNPCFLPDVQKISSIVVNHMTEKNTTRLPVTQAYDIINVVGNDCYQTWADVCIEESINLFVNNTRIASLTITPQDLEAYAYGYLICEGIVADKSAIQEVSIELPDIYVTTSSFSRDPSLMDTEIRSSGCVGIRTQWSSLSRPLGDGITIDLSTLFSGMKKLNDCASLWRITGGTHCTAILDESGSLISSIEDMGRHNSVDKTVGKALLDDIDLSRCFMVCTGRLPAGMVAKAYRAGISIIGSNTAPFSTGICLARQVNMTLAGFVRPPNAMIYSVPERIRLDTTSCE